MRIERRQGHLFLLNPDGSVLMCDTPDEVDKYLPFIEQARGRVLLTGFGLGYMLKALLAKPEVEWVTVVEWNVELVASALYTYAGERCSFVYGDAYTWEPRGRYDMAFHSVWVHWDLFTVYEMARIMDHYQTHVDYQECDWEPQVLSWILEQPEGDIKRELMEAGTWAA